MLLFFIMVYCELLYFDFDTIKNLHIIMTINYNDY